MSFRPGLLLIPWSIFQAELAQGIIRQASKTRAIIWWAHHIPDIDQIGNIKLSKKS
jgi:hypothetical protein